ncbi:gamma-glutamylcyclotransferase family protein [Vreelandella rituensis]|uniref:Gamma-glutamylcyclotransferase n=2 Tax=Vreelandella rituensis TaxID=2282306 RepID=A0A368TPA1_9GAMM|nr:gamma-glutamylcyclotransferase [Halomonas rituensis]
MLCFSYGSNMSSKRLLARLSSASFVMVARLPYYRLAFHKAGTDGSGKGDIVPASAQAEVYGVVWEIPDTQKAVLDSFEGLGFGYDEITITVFDLTTDKPMDVQAYIATRTRSGLKPYDWYKNHVINGAREHGLPEHYIAALEAVKALEDKKRKRFEQEVAIYQ